MISFFTLAGNQLGAARSGVDPRTGQFGAAIQLGHMTGNGLRGPQMPLGLGYQPFATQDYGFGRGWALPWTTYDPNTGDLGTLFASEGANFKVTKDNNPSITQQKPPALDFALVGNDYVVTHAHGGVEVLGETINSISVPSQIFTPLGNSVTLSWSQDPYGVTAIEDDAGNTLLSASYQSGSSATLTLNPGTPDEVDISAIIDGELLQSITVGDWAWQFFYTDVGAFGPDIPQLLYKIVHPTGLVEEATYTGDIMAFPEVARKTAQLPAVTTYTKTPNGVQPSQVCEYEYQNNGDNPTGNFLGYGAALDTWDDDRDNLYYATESYSYTTLCKEMSGSEMVSTIERTFDQFHCIRSEVRTKGLCESKVEYDYDGQRPGTFDDQSNTFLMPTKKTTTYTGPDGAGTPEYSTDDYDPDSGDKTTHKTYDGVTTAYAYYPIEGAGDDCPPNPNGLDRCIKSITTTYPDKGTYVGFIKVKSYTHCKVNVGGTVDDVNDPIPYAVMPHVETTTVGGTTIHTLEYAYVDDTTPGKDQGRVSKATETVYDDEGTPHVSTTTFTYTHDDANKQLTVSKTFTAEDKKTSKTTSSVYSVVSGREVSSTDELGVTTVYAYDVHGREKTRTMAAGSDYERTMSFTNAFEKLYTTDTITVPTRTTTYPSGAQEKVWYDGSMRAIRHEKYITTTGYNVTPYDAWMKASTSTYDDQGHLVGTQAFDWRTKTIPLISPTTTLHYDDWGQNDLTTYASGRFEGAAHDPVAKTTTHTWSGTGSSDVDKAKRVIQYNEQNLPASVTIYDKNGAVYAGTASTYDGARRLRQFTDVLGHTVSIDYDAWSRPHTITLPDGVVVTRSYETFTGVDLIAEITVKDPAAANPTSLGTQTHDGLHRVTQAVVGGRTTKHHYKDSGPVPDYTTEPDGTQLTYTYIPELGCAMATCKGGDVDLQLTYDPKGGWLTAASDAKGPGLTLTYDLWGNLTSRAVAYDKTRTRTESYGTSAFGRLLTFVNVGGDRTGYDFDYNTGLPVSDTLGAQKAVTYAFTNGVLTGWTAGQSTVTLTMDEFVRETDRLVKRSGSTYELQQHYYVNNALKQRTSLLGAQTLRDDGYTYDSRNRVAKLASTGSSLAVDPYGKSITEQDFVYDAIDNLKTVTTTFTGGTDLATYTYDTADPCQLKSITHSGSGYPPGIALAYDANGRMTTDDQGRTLGYDALGRLGSITAGSTTTGYLYDGVSVRRAQQLADGSSLEFYYRGHYPISTIKHSGAGDATTAWLRHGGNCMLEKGPDGSLKDIVTDAKASVVATGGTGGLNARDYTAYGYAPPGDSAQSALGYNGEYTDPVTGNYHLGNGYRAFSPALGRFTAPDSLAPFGAGGLNTYAYCEGDPINAIDPTGHMKWWQWGLLIGATVVSAALTVDDGWEAVVAFKAIQKFAQIGEEMAISEAAALPEDQVAVMDATAARATRLARLSKYKVAFHGILAAKNAVATGLGGTMIVAAVVQKGGIRPNCAYQFMQWAPTVVGFLDAMELARIPTSRVYSSLERELSEYRVGEMGIRGVYTGFNDGVEYTRQRAPMARDDIYVEVHGEPSAHQYDMPPEEPYVTFPHSSTQDVDVTAPRGSAALPEPLTRRPTLSKTVQVNRWLATMAPPPVRVGAVPAALDVMPETSRVEGRAILNFRF
jgi:RHS repeat-associated protein